MQIAFGGQVSEELFFGDVSTGPAGDLAYATNVAAQMVGAAGMAGSSVSFAAIQDTGLTGTDLVGKVLADARCRERVEELLDEQKAIAHQLLGEQPAPRDRPARRPAGARGAGRLRDHGRARSGGGRAASRDGLGGRPSGRSRRECT